MKTSKTSFLQRVIAFLLVMPVHYVKGYLKKLEKEDIIFIIVGVILLILANYDFLIKLIK